MERSERIRAILVFVLLGITALLLVFRLAWLQLGGVASARARAERQFLRKEGVPSGRGTVVDRNGVLLAYDRPAFDVVAEITVKEGAPPRGFPETVVQELIDAVSADHTTSAAERAALRRTLSERFTPPKNARLRPIGKRSEPGAHTASWTRPLFDGVESSSALEALLEVDRRHGSIRLEFRGVTSRVYPLGGAASHLTGLVAQEERGGWVHYGLEALPACDAGAPGFVPLRIDGKGRGYLGDGGRAADPPRVVRTTIDAGLQQAADRILRERLDPEQVEWSCLVLLDLKDGGVLAMAGHPAFDPAAPKGGVGFYCPAIQAPYEPGSAIKPLILSFAVDVGLARPGEKILCTGSEVGTGIVWRVRGVRPIEDDHFVGLTDLEGVIAESSNIGAVKVGMRLKGRLKEALDLFGVGVPTGIPLPHELRGRQPRADRWRSQRQLEIYTGPSVCTGYELEMTPLQLARAFGMLITGHTFEPRLVHEVVKADGTVVRAAETERRRVLSESTVAFARHAMKETLLRPRGTGHDIADETTRGLVGGKSGTSWRHNTKGSRTYSATFVAFAPADEPRFLVLAAAQKSFTHKFYGGKYAAPAARDLLLEALGGVFGSRPHASRAFVAPGGTRATEQGAREVGGAR